MTHQNLAFLTYEDKKDKIYFDRMTRLFFLQQIKKFSRLSIFRAELIYTANIFYASFCSLLVPVPSFVGFPLRFFPQ